MIEEFKRRLNDWAQNANEADCRFAAANILMDDRLTASRLENYIQCLNINSCGSALDWKENHRKYVSGKRFILNEWPQVYSSTNHDFYPELFRHIECRVDLTKTPGSKLLFRLTLVDKLIRIANEAGYRNKNGGELTREELEQLIQDSKDASSEHGIYAATKLQEILDYESNWCQQYEPFKPYFATFWEDIKKLIYDSNGLLDPQWIHQVRDVLGLSSYKRKNSSPLFVVALCYSIECLPKYDSDIGQPAITAPTQLDFSFYDAFCPYPLNQEPGQTVNLCPGGYCQQEPFKEILHGFSELTYENFFAIGKIESNPSSVEPCRKRHLAWLGSKIGRALP